MPTAYNWLRSLKKLLKIHIDCDETSIIAKLTYFSKQIKIEYVKTGVLLASVECRELKEDDTIQKSFVEVFCEDLREILGEQETSLELFEINSPELNPNSYYDKIFECIESSLKSRNQKLRIKAISLVSKSIEEAVNLIVLLDPTRLLKLYLYVKKPNIDELELLICWKNGERLLLHLILDAVLMEHLVSVKKLLHHSSIFHEVIIKAFKPIVIVDLRKFFEPFSFARYNNLLVFKLEKFENCEDLEDSMKKLAIEKGVELQALSNRLVMEILLKELQCFDIQSLRRVSRYIRGCIDLLKPEPHIERYSLFVKHDEDSFINIELKNGQMKKRKYPDSYKYWKMEDDDANEIVRKTLVKDFEINLKFQNVPMRELRLKIYKLEYLRMIGEVLKNRPSQLCVENLIIQIIDGSDMMEILSYLDPAFIKSIELLNQNLHKPFDIVKDKRFEEFYKLNLENVSKLDQWKNLEILIANKFIIKNSIQEIKIENFVTVDIIMKNMSNQDVLFLKNELMKSSKFQKFKIVFSNSSIDDALFNLVTPVFRRAHNRSIWYFRMQNRETLNFLHILYHVQQQMFVFSCGNSGSVPDQVLAQELLEDRIPLL